MPALRATSRAPATFTEPQKISLYNSIIYEILPRDGWAAEFAPDNRGARVHK
jgi:hypothetical protein